MNKLKLTREQTEILEKQNWIIVDDIIIVYDYEDECYYTYKISDCDTEDVEFEY